MEKPTNNGRFIDLEGMTFGALSVRAYAGSVKNLAMWECQCACGMKCVIRGNSLRTGNTTSCGCTRKANAAAASKFAATTHGMYGTPTYRSWQAMIARCDRPSHKSYKDYGGRGVRICSAWYSFDAFFADMGTRPEGKTLDRIENLGDYEPGNCKWSTPKEQANNRRRPSKRRISEVTGLQKTAAVRDGCRVWDLVGGAE